MKIDGWAVFLPLLILASMCVAVYVKADTLGWGLGVAFGCASTAWAFNRHASHERWKWKQQMQDNVHTRWKNR